AALGAHQLGGRGDETSPMRGKDGLPGGSVALEEGAVGTFMYQSGIGVYRQGSRQSTAPRRNRDRYPMVGIDGPTRSANAMSAPHRLYAAFLAAGSLTLAACGSSGGGTAPPSSPPPP